MDLIEVTNNPNRHPWELSRTKCLIRELKTEKISGRVLDIGCGDSYFDRSLLRELPQLEVWGVDINLSADLHEGKLHAVRTLNSLPEKPFDCILLMDVLEHIENDKAFLCELLNRLNPEGIVFITVPAFMELYSKHDEILKHFRRYNHAQLATLIQSSGLEEYRWSYFYFILILGRLLTKNSESNLGDWKRSGENWMTKAVTQALNIDFNICRKLSELGIHLPGLSLMSVCRIRT